MFWTKKTTESEEFTKLFANFQNLRIEVETLKLDLALYKNKLLKRAGIKSKEEEEDEKEIKDAQKPNVLLGPTGSTLK